MGMERRWIQKEFKKGMFVGTVECGGQTGQVGQSARRLVGSGRQLIEIVDGLGT